MNDFKLPPQNLDVEESILAGCLLFPELLEDTIDNILPEHFYKSAHQKIYKTIIQQFKSKNPVDLITIATALKANNLLNEIGGIPYLNKLIDTPIPSSMLYSCETIREAAILRKTIAISNNIINACYANADAKEVIADAQKNILSIDSLTRDNFTTMEDLTVQSIDRYENRGNKNTKKIKTGFFELDTLTGGIGGSKLIILAARPRIGKTAMLLNMAKYISSHGSMVGVFEIEMDKEDLDDRLMSSFTGINTIKLQSGKYLNHDDWLRINESAEIKSNLPILIDDTGGLKIAELKRRARKMKKMGCKIIFIDQLSKIIGDRRKSKFEEATGIVEELGHLKKELRMPIVLLAQINRKSIDRQDRKPMLEDLKNTGQLEEEGDLVLLIHRPYVYTKNPDEEKVAILDIAKNRGGPERAIDLEWNGKTTTFLNPTQKKEF